MATSSITEPIVVENAEAVERLADALEQSEKAVRRMKINGIDVTAPVDIDYEELLAYVEREKQQFLTIRSMDVLLDSDYAEITVHTANKPFERIRRITGYLVGTMPRWNDAKRSEERDRVKHTLTE